VFVLFPVSDYYQLDELLTPEEKNLRINIRQFMENEVAPIVPKVLLHLFHYFICAYSIYPFFSNVILVLADA
jgi:acyl-CoA oxidase